LEEEGHNINILPTKDRLLEDYIAQLSDVVKLGTVILDKLLKATSIHFMRISGFVIQYKKFYVASV